MRTCPLSNYFSDNRLPTDLLIRASRGGRDLALIASTSTASLAGARQDAKVLMAPDPAALKLEQDWGFSPAILTGDTAYLSGVVASVREGESDLRLGYTPRLRTDPCKAAEIVSGYRDRHCRADI